MPRRHSCRRLLLALEHNSSDAKSVPTGNVNGSPGVPKSGDAARRSACATKTEGASSKEICRDSFLVDDRNSHTVVGEGDGGFVGRPDRFKNGLAGFLHVGCNMAEQEPPGAGISRGLSNSSRRGMERIEFRWRIRRIEHCTMKHQKAASSRQLNKVRHRGRIHVS